MKKLVVLTGAGISAESGIPTFRDAGGLWEGYRIEDVATPEAWQRNPALVLDFYNQRRKRALQAEPNQGHRILAELEAYYDVTVVTQNVDNLHERAGSSHVIHLHGSLFEARSSVDESLIYPVNGWEMKLGETCAKGSQLRPNIVWFGEPVPRMEEAIAYAAKADVFLVVGTSLVVYPAAGLLYYTRHNIPRFLIDPNIPDTPAMPHFTCIADKASSGLARIKPRLIEIA